MKAVIMAGGEGTRLRPLTCTIPKPMVPIINKPAMEYIIELLKTISINEVNVTTYYLPSIISDYFGDGHKFGITINYYKESSPLGTGGSVLNTNIDASETVIVISGDCVTNIDLNSALKFHKSKKAKATLILKQEKVPLEYGIVITDKTGRITRFLEKPAWGEVFSDTVNTGIYILEGDVFGYYNRGERFDFSKDLFPKLLSNNIPMYGYVTDSYWNDIGDMHSYKQTQFDILNEKISLNNLYTQVKPGIYMGENTSISDTAVINSPAIIGSNCIIKDDALIDSYSIIGDNSIINENVSIKRSILWNRVNIGRNSQCRGTTICSGTVIHDNVNLFENSIIGSNSIIHNGATVNPEIKIWPYKNIESNSTVITNMVWADKLPGFSSISNCITGELNREITPEYSSILGTAFSTIIKSDSPLLVSTDASMQADFIVNSIVSGVLSTGKKVILIKELLVPVSRYAIRYFNCCAGIHIRKNYENSNMIHIELYNDIGGNIDRKHQRELEQLLQRGDFERCDGNKLEHVTEITNFLQIYTTYNKTLISNTKAIQHKQPNILISTNSNLVANLANSFLSMLGCKVTVNLENSFNNSLHQNTIQNMMKKRSYDFGMYLHDAGENIMLFDETGNIISDDNYRVLTSLISIKSGNCSRIIVPIDMPSIITSIAKDNNVEIIKSHSSTTDIINSMLSHGNSDSGNIIQFSLNYDGILACGRIISYLTSNNISLIGLFKQLPDFHIRKNELECDFDKRGYIIRKLIEDTGASSPELFEGIKINYKNGWALILPDNDKPVFRVLTEGFSEEFAEEIITGVNSKLMNLINEQIN